ncbi:MAG: hypothetical protein U9R28_07380 [Pseudomonadota bacterium]|nr:hypothetical protein [Pseudomonadota bacterium]
MFEYFLAWFPMVLIAIANGAIRQAVLEKRFSKLRAHQISCLTAVLLFFVYVDWFHAFWPLASVEKALLVGIMWLGMSLTFEFFFGHFVMKQAWSVLLQDYNVFKGRLWSLVLLFTLFLPYLVFQLAN